MADQVNPTGSLAPSIPLTVLTVPKSKPQSAQEPSRPVKPAESQPTPLADGRTDTSAKALDSAVKEFTDYLQQTRSDLRFQVDESSGHTYFKIINPQTKEVIRQIPSEEILAMARKLRELATTQGAPGVLVDKEG